MSGPAIIALLWRPNLRVLDAFAKQHPGVTVLSWRDLLPPEAQQRISEAGGTPVQLESLLELDEQYAAIHQATTRHDKLVHTVAEPGWQGRFPPSPIAPALLAECLSAESAARLPSLMLVLEALERAAVRYDVRLLIVNEDMTPGTRLAAVWARRRGIPSLELSHGLFLSELYTIHGRLVCEHTAIFGERARENYHDIGVDPSRLHLTGNPSWDDYPELRQRKPEIRARMATAHGLALDRPIVMFGLTMDATLTALGDNDTLMRTLRAFLRACKELLASGLALQPVIKDRVAAQSTAQALKQLVGELGLPPDSVCLAAGSAIDWVLTSDVVVSVDSNLSVEAILAGVPAINLLGELGMFLGPSFDADAGIVEVEEPKLGEAIRELLVNGELRAARLFEMQRAELRHNLGIDGQATRRVVELMSRLSMLNQAPGSKPQQAA
jgi:hypothetical protein